MNLFLKIVYLSILGCFLVYWVAGSAYWLFSRNEKEVQKSPFRKKILKLSYPITLIAWAFIWAASLVLLLTGMKIRVFKGYLILEILFLFISALAFGLFVKKRDSSIFWKRPVFLLIVNSVCFFALLFF